jgi:hypothetical protein
VIREERKSASRHIAEARDEAEHRIPPETNPRSRDGKIVIEHAGKPAHLREPLVMTHSGAEVAKERG